jgi:hypothetical protein
MHVAASYEAKLFHSNWKELAKGLVLFMGKKHISSIVYAR